MTLGQRIAQKRRELGLSQEQLGQEMGVSRQAIYKWESDAAMPEIDKLIALSRRFGVSVGWLLGEEEAPEAEAPDGEPLTEEQIRLIEKLVAAYQPPRSKKQRRAIWAACVTAGLLVLLVIVALSRLSDLSSHYSDLDSQLDNIRRNYADFNLQLGNITDQVQSAMEEQADLIAARQVKLESYDPAGNTVTFQLSVTPKTYTEGMRASFIALTDGQTVEVAAEGKQSFSASLTCPVSDEIQLLVAFVDGETRSTQTLEVFDHLWQETLPNVEVYLTYTCYAQQKTSWYLRQDSVAYLYLNFSDSGDVQRVPRATIRSLRVGLFQDQTLLCWMDQKGELSFPEGYSYTLPHNVELSDGQYYRVAAVLTDSFGRELVVSDELLYWNASAQDLMRTGDGTGYQNPVDWSY